MKKKILFIIPSLTSGGGEKSLVSLLQLIDFDKFDVDLFLFSENGLFLRSVPEQVRLAEHSELFDSFSLPLAGSLKSLAAHRGPGAALNRLRYAASLRRVNGPSLKKDQYSWKYLKRAFGEPSVEYDAAIGYLEGNSIYYCVDCVKAKKKIGYIHSDYSKLGLDPAFDAPYFDRLDHIVTVSPECEKVLRETFPGAASKIRVIENITSPRILERLACEDAPEYAFADKIKLLTVGRIKEPKGCDIAVEAAAALKSKGLSFTWYWIGAGEQRETIEGRIKELGLEDDFVLLGERANPYPYVKGCDIYVQPSRFEGKSIAIDEAKCLKKPIVATRFTTVADQLTDGETALLAEIDPADIAGKIYLLAGDEPLREKLSDSLSREKVGNEEEIAEFYEMIG